MILFCAILKINTMELNTSNQVQALQNEEVKKSEVEVNTNNNTTAEQNTEVSGTNSEITDQQKKTLPVTTQEVEEEELPTTDIISTDLSDDAPDIAPTATVQKSQSKSKLKPAKADKVYKVRDRMTLTGNYTAAEYANIRKAIDYRISNGNSTSIDNFVRQCIDFALCHGSEFTKDYLKLPKGYTSLFGIPDDEKILPLERKGFFNK